MNSLLFATFALVILSNSLLYGADDELIRRLRSREEPRTSLKLIGPVSKLALPLSAIEDIPELKLQFSNVAQIGDLSPVQSQGLQVLILVATSFPSDLLDEPGFSIRTAKRQSNISDYISFRMKRSAEVNAPVAIVWRDGRPPSIHCLRQKGDSVTWEELYQLKK